jgi:hypothetical protein
MEHGRYVLSFPVEPDDLLERLGSILATQGPPAVTVRRHAGAYVFEGATAEFMVRARAADALSTVWLAWRDLAQEVGAQPPPG